jgi:excisionase family DNA binding protein
MTISNVAEAEPLLMEVQAAKFLSVSVRTLQNWRIKQSGPPFIRIGRAVRYRRSDLSTWIDANTVGSGLAKGNGRRL